MPDQSPPPKFVTRNIERCAKFVPHGELAQHDQATPLLAQAVRDLHGNVCSLREYLNDLEDRVAMLEARLSDQDANH